MKSSDKISDVKAKLHETMGVRASLQQLFYGDTHLMDDKTLADFGIARNSTLNMYISSESEEQIFIKTSKGNTITLEAKSWETIHTIKTKIREKEGIPLGQQELFYAGRLLEDIHSLNFYGIKMQSTLHMVLHNDGLQISVATPHGETITLDVKTSYTVYDVKMLIESKTGLQQSLQRLTYNDQTLQDSGDLSRINDTIDSIRGKIRSKLGALSVNQRIFFAGKRLDLEKTFEHYGIEKGSTLNLVSYAPSKTINPVVVEMYDGGTISLYAKMSSTIGELKAMIQERTHIPSKKQMLRHLDQCLDKDDHTLNDYCIHIGSRLFLGKKK
ncbi:Polyubiquitin 8 [Acorus calamus]|uniref:Polyubiquitin 8 n=1 Tax=Acorus calamus TaxID=4465 RepID=A0AAV9C568_ACOCL|nr:Polyubiquitin 8 [Acorus calamus]